MLRSYLQGSTCYWLMTPCEWCAHLQCSCYHVATIARLSSVASIQCCDVVARHPSLFYRSTARRKITVSEVWRINCFWGKFFWLHKFVQLLIEGSWIWGDHGPHYLLCLVTYHILVNTCNCLFCTGGVDVGQLLWCWCRRPLCSLCHPPSKTGSCSFLTKVMLNITEMTNLARSCLLRAIAAKPAYVVY